MVAEHELESLSRDADRLHSEWMKLPEEIRNDSSMTDFVEKYQAAQNFNDVQCPVQEAYDPTRQRQSSSVAEENNKHSSIAVAATRYLKLGSLFFVWLLAAAFLLTKPEKNVKFQLLSVPARGNRSLTFADVQTNEKIALRLEGFFPDEAANVSASRIKVELHIHEEGNDELITNSWYIPVSLDAPQSNRKYDFSLPRAFQHVNLSINVDSNVPEAVPMRLSVDLVALSDQIGAILATFSLVFLYTLIIWEVVHRTFAALLASTLAIAFLAALDDRPTTREIVGWVDVETILLLLSMMILVGVLKETGVFDYLAVYVYQLTRGKVWALVHCLCLFTTLVSSILDNVTTTLLISPVTIRLCEVMQLNPVPILMAVVIHANIGGTTTPIGDPPNVIITSNPFVVAKGVSFVTFSLHMGLGVIICVLCTALFLRIFYRHPDSMKSPHFTSLAIWQAALDNFDPPSPSTRPLYDRLSEQIANLSAATNFNQTLKMMQKAYPIRNRTLLIKSGLVMIFVMTLFLVQSVPTLRRLSLSWCALLGVLSLLIIAEKDDMDAILSRIEWSTLLFFAAMFVLMEAVDRLGLIAYIGRLTEYLILAVPHGARLGLAIVIILWVSGLVSAFVDSIPVTVMMVKVVVRIGENAVLALPVQPLIWALAFGPCLGGNGTLVGASANVVCAGIAQQAGYRISFVEFLKLGFPVMLVSLIATTVYLLLAHSLFTWH